MLFLCASVGRRTRGCSRLYLVICSSNKHLALSKAQGPLNPHSLYSQTGVYCGGLANQHIFLMAVSSTASSRNSLFKNKKIPSGCRERIQTRCKSQICRQPETITPVETVFLKVDKDNLCSEV